MVQLDYNPPRWFYMTLQNDKLSNEIDKLIQKNLFSQAIMEVLRRGRYLRESDDDRAFNNDADLILTSESAYHLDNPEFFPA